ncbi:DUF4097 family beta strand repeat-containing protein [Plebeiibacterium marinum]|uniref:DUF4097 domain-containing protein n=1 Tax=Plebeiibacterium marinum TaxID=2992111 RepID=A0AAE3MC13_9BACT|nr:DUF4097 family beta strand repeat-containing protein [Plebeiobacterium marinum]MCW3805143.1 DUF4097 domain-containing protein [Plebeiobacterium marinum]
MKTFLSLTLAVFTLNSCIINNATGQQTIIDKAEKNFDNIASIDVKGAFCHVDITSHPDSNVSFKGEIRSKKERDDIKIKYKINGNTLEVWIEHPNNLWGSFSGDLNFQVPENTNINVRNSSGGIDISNIGQSTVDLVSSSGSITAKYIDSNLKATASSGSLNISDIGGNVKATCSSGSHKIERVKGNVSATASSGTIRISDIKGSVKSTSSSGSQILTNIESDIHATGSSGSIKMENINGSITARVSSGSIRITNAKGVLDLISSSGSQSGIGITLNGNSSFKSSSGSIKMELTNSAKDLSFNLAASSGSLNAKGAEGKKKLIIEKGNIKVHGISSSGSQSYR